jgi:hypothetical protein
MSLQTEAPNYWPGFVDALVTVLLNLLFLVGVFAIGLVSLNLEVMIVQKKLAEEEVRALLAVKNGMQPLLKGEVVNLKPALPVVPSEPLPTLLPVPTSASKVQVRIHEIKIQDFSGEAETLNLGDDLVDGSTGPARALLSVAVQKFLEQRIGGQFIERIAFEPQQFDWSAERSLPALDDSKTHWEWILVILTDKNNSRLTREAYTRLGAIRAAYFRMGAGPEKMKIQIHSIPPELGPLLAFNNTVWILRQPVPN